MNEQEQGAIGLIISDSKVYLSKINEALVHATGERRAALLALKRTVEKNLNALKD